MSRYPKGQHTLNTIVECAKELFYEKGYSKTTIQEICDSANITLGNFTYYFNTKRELLSKIYSDYIKALDKFVLENTDEYPDFFDKFLISVFIYNYKILNDPKTAEFTKGIILNGSLFDEILLKMDPEEFTFSYKALFKSNSEREGRLIYLADIGMRKEFTLFYLKNKDAFKSSLDFSIEMSRILCRIYKANDEEMRKKFSDNEDFLNRIRQCPISLLV